jgi:hypothetical protein
MSEKELKNIKHNLNCPEQINKNYNEKHEIKINSKLNLKILTLKKENEKLKEEL